jgi:HK97 family phage prohead protease
MPLRKAPERRYITGNVEIRDGANGPVLEGYALKFNTVSQDLGGFVETVGSNALNKTLSDGGDVLCRYQHSDDYILGRTGASTLTLTRDDVGLYYSCPLPDTDYARNIAALAGRGDIPGSSFAFRVVGPTGDTWTETPDGYLLRVLNEIQLLDVAPVVQPAYLDTSAAIRSLAEIVGMPLDEVGETPLNAIWQEHREKEAQEPVDDHSEAIQVRRTALLRKRQIV